MKKISLNQISNNNKMFIFTNKSLNKNSTTKNIFFNIMFNFVFIEIYNT